MDSGYIDHTPQVDVLHTHGSRLVYIQDPSRQTRAPENVVQLPPFETTDEHCVPAQYDVHFHDVHANAHSGDPKTLIQQWVLQSGECPAAQMVSPSRSVGHGHLDRLPTHGLCSRVTLQWAGVPPDGGGRARYCGPGTDY